MACVQNCLTVGTNINRFFHPKNTFFEIFSQENRGLEISQNAFSRSFQKYREYREISGEAIFFWYTFSFSMIYTCYSVTKWHFLYRIPIGKVSQLQPRCDILLRGSNLHLANFKLPPRLKSKPCLEKRANTGLYRERKKLRPILYVSTNILFFSIN